jgi:preprotein translocase subunit SecF
VKSVSFNPFYYKFDFVKRRKIFYLFSAILIGAGIISLLIQGLNLGIDFTSGSRVEVLIGQKFSDVEIRSLLAEAKLEPSSIVTAGEGKDLTAVLSYKGTINKEQFAQIGKIMKSKYGENVALSESTISPIVGRDLARNSFYALAIASIGIIIYVALRFEYRFAIAAILALLHDVMIMIGFFSIFQIEVESTFIVAALTIIGYSINDTIVIFDRIRENMKRTKLKRKEDLENLVNDSIRQTLVRSINTVMTVIFSSLALLIFGGPGIRIFSLALTVGLFFGAYSSIFIASQIWVEWKGKDLEKERFRTQPQNQ